ncbi:PREDICTED: atherin-like [Cercocebus atys]|uniref:atherin-like n=1 Tax=Cercocebus atys TaxID=9531 RepID=UPI0005F36C6E|nr:PREDICTED: atherin-like [Cercocebus atys]
MGPRGSESGGARLQPAKRPPARRGPAPAAAAAGRRLRALQPRRHPRGTAPDPLPGAPVRAAPGPRTAFSGPAGRSRGAGCQPAAFRHRAPAWPPRSSAAARRARAVRCTCSSAGRQPTLGQHSPGETNPSAARRASGPAPLAPAARCSAPLPPPPESQNSSERRRCSRCEPGAGGAPGARGGCGLTRLRGTRQAGRGSEITPRRPARLSVGDESGRLRRGSPGTRTPGRGRLQAGSGCQAGGEPSVTLKRLQRPEHVLKQEAPGVWCLPEYFAHTRLINYF